MNYTTGVENGRMSTGVGKHSCMFWVCLALRMPRIADGWLVRCCCAAIMNINVKPGSSMILLWSPTRVTFRL